MKKLYLTTAAILLAVPAAFATSDVEAITVIKTENGPVRIPASSFDAKEHTLHVADETHDEHGVVRSNHGNNPAPQASAPVAGSAGLIPPVAPILDPVTAQIASTAPAAPPKQYGVLQNKGRFYIVNSADGTPVTDVPAIEAKGYTSNKDAWEAMVKLQVPS